VSFSKKVGFDTCIYFIIISFFADSKAFDGGGFSANQKTYI
jgi:hypothetical protein